MYQIYTNDEYSGPIDTVSDIPLMEQTQRDSLEHDFCPVGHHELALESVIDPSKTTIFGFSASRTLIFCRKCPFHYFPEPPTEGEDAPDESETISNGLPHD